MVSLFFIGFVFLSPYLLLIKVFGSPTGSDRIRCAPNHFVEKEGITNCARKIELICSCSCDCRCGRLVAFLWYQYSSTGTKITGIIAPTENSQIPTIEYVF